MRIDTVIWLLIYGGMTLTGLGLALRRGDASLGWTLFGVGTGATAVGIALIGVRSRMQRET